jgi:multiple sugar transport system ATP-binding protein
VTTRAELKRLHHRLKTTTIYVTHDQEEAMTLGDRIVVMRDGLIQQADTPLVTYNNPVNRFVAGFIGMPPMNFFDGTIKMVDGQMVFEEGKLAHAHAAAGTAPGSSREAGNGKPRSDEPVVMVGELTLPGNGFTLPLSKLAPDGGGRGAERLAGQVGRHVVLGIRPEHFHLQSTGDHTAPLNVRVSVTEPLGNDMDVYMSTALHDHVVGRVEAPSNTVSTSGLVMNSQITVYVDLRKVHFFEPGVTGMNLSLKNERAAAVA